MDSFSVERVKPKYEKDSWAPIGRMFRCAGHIFAGLEGHPTVYFLIDKQYMMLMSESSNVAEEINPEIGKSASIVDVRIA